MTKSSRLAATLERNPDVAGWLGFHFGGSLERPDIGDIKAGVDEIIFREFDELNLDDGDFLLEERGVVTRIGNGARDSTSFARTTEVRYFIHFHIEGADKTLRCTWADGAMEGGSGHEDSIWKAIRSRLNWHTENWARKLNRPILFDFVIKRTIVWNEPKHARRKYAHACAEVYRFPTHYTPPTPKITDAGYIGADRHAEL